MTGGNNMNSLDKVFKNTSNESIHSFARKMKGGKILSEIDIKNQMGSTDSPFVTKSLMDKKKSLSKRGEKVNVYDAESKEITFEENGEIRNIIGCTQLPFVIIGGYVFSHANFLSLVANSSFDGGISTRTDLYIFNRLIREWILGILSDAEINKEMTDRMNVQNTGSSTGRTEKGYGEILTNRFLGNLETGMNDPESCSSIKNELRIIDVGHIIVGHTPQFLVEQYKPELATHTESTLFEESRKYKFNANSEFNFPLKDIKKVNGVGYNIGINSACNNTVIKVDNGGYKRYGYDHTNTNEMSDYMKQYTNTMTGRFPQVLIIQKNSSGNDEFRVRRRNMEAYYRHLYKRREMGRRQLMLKPYDVISESKCDDEFLLNPETGLLDNI